MTDDAVEISPLSWEYRLVAAVVYAVEQRAGGAAAGARTRWNDDEKSAESEQAAQNAIAGLDHELDRIERGYRVEKAQRAQQQAGRPGTRRTQAVRQAQDRMSPDLERLRAVTSGQAPAAGATSRSAEAVDHAQQGPNDGSRGRQAPGRPSGPRGRGSAERA
ncbi:hypothetical protein ACWEOO_30070 [Kribbella sp. NPDC004138]